jgi:hypothetical protein
MPTRMVQNFRMLSMECLILIISSLVTPAQPSRKTLQSLNFNDFRDKTMTYIDRKSEAFQASCVAETITAVNGYVQQLLSIFPLMTVLLVSKRCYKAVHEISHVKQCFALFRRGRSVVLPTDTFTVVVDLQLHRVGQQLKLMETVSLDHTQPANRRVFAAVIWRVVRSLLMKGNHTYPVVKLVDVMKSCGMPVKQTWILSELKKWSQSGLRFDNRSDEWSCSTLLEIILPTATLQSVMMNDTLKPSVADRATTHYMTYDMFQRIIGKERKFIDRTSLDFIAFAKLVWHYSRRVFTKQSLTLAQMKKNLIIYTHSYDWPTDTIMNKLEMNVETLNAPMSNWIDNLIHYVPKSV